ncbi:hypothetical protein AALO_G00148610 [Alosa alosa]|uniref:Pro-neuregulin-4, membrane-bound isoform n=1 Tax=Alosa alosa TaxID=278164 RepID=A0AAV6GI98_9TELE|nr:pro-neuregulin-4, membrane-bound isoform-like [Alosa alosa]KAG5273186.1 hypothetical protein AALO_G00148610 [Alosa alosa]
MMADHGDPCDPSEASFCMNGGSCYKIPSVSTPTCRCIDNYKGSRCEQFLLESRSSTESGIIAAVVIMVLLIVVMLAVIIYYTCKLKRSKEQNQPTREQYWKVQHREPRV